MSDRVEVLDGVFYSVRKGESDGGDLGVLEAKFRRVDPKSFKEGKITFSETVYHHVAVVCDARGEGPCVLMGSRFLDAPELRVLADFLDTLPKPKGTPVE